MVKNNFPDWFSLLRFAGRGPRNGCPEEGLSLDQ